MATRKKKAAPRQVWIVIRDGDTAIPASATTRKRAIELIEDVCDA